jgi:transcription antitermination factor NusG
MGITLTPQEKLETLPFKSLVGESPGALVAATLSTPLPAEESRQWYALYIIRNHEKKVAQQLLTKEVEAFLPLYTVTKRWKNNVTAKVELPLFPGYLFVRIARTERVRVLEVPGIVSIVGNGREFLPLPDHEVEAFRQGLHLRRVDPYPYLTVGQRARIRSGPLAGLEGVVVRKDDRLRIVLSLDLIMSSIAVQVDADELEACE